MADAVYCRNGHHVGYLPEPNYDHDHVRVLREYRAVQVKAQLARMEFCTACGAESIGGCLNCQAAIDRDPFDKIRPAYCGSCGKPFPWTVTALQAAKEYTDELELSGEDKLALKGAIDDLTVDSPRTELAVRRFAKYVRKIAPAAGEALKTIVVNVVTEAAKKKMGL